ncbi:GTP-binding protein YqeH [Melissococcus plutonius DAT561]|uniref:GTP-binding protein YqeH n=1 Tax=Melissococcus plutonius TaxID=33970 RepID=A0A2Z5Y3K3_9ENTE|nr:ribosome biogenesis GTPase YqeH [Melissococcus plutonius]BAL62548.1 GTP-binding protein YqeH [Melissococcus plutonius DAT561]BBC61435.1 GTP-binding protein YqeH [Melissococcus plutonius]
MNDQIQCIGCGAVIQTETPKKLGYLPKSAYEKGKEKQEIYCQRCFRLRHYNEIQSVDLTNDDFLRLLNELNKEDALIINLVDIFDFDGSLISSLSRFVGNNPILLIGNKRDILPKSLKKHKLIKWMKERAYDEGLRPIDIQLISAKNPSEIVELLETIEYYRNGRDVYIVGVTNVGKSTLINQIIKQTSGEEEVITTSQFPGTTLDKIKIPLADGQFLIDTPGIIHHHQMAHYLGKKELKKIMPQKEIKPKIYQLNAGQILFFGGMARFDFIMGDRNSFIAYLANDLTIHRTKMANADAFYGKHLGGLLEPPNQKEVAGFPELVRYEFSIKEKSDIVFSGLGWITVTSPGIVAGWAPKGVSVLKRKALI